MIGNIDLEYDKDIIVRFSDGIYISNQDERDVLEIEKFNALYRLVFGELKNKIMISGIECCKTRSMHNKICEILQILSSNPNMMFIYEDDYHPKLKVGISFKSLKELVNFIIWYYRYKGISELHINQEIKKIEDVSIDSILSIPLTRLHNIEDFSVELLDDDDNLVRITGVFGLED